MMMIHHKFIIIYVVQFIFLNLTPLNLSFAPLYVVQLGTLSRIRVVVLIPPSVTVTCFVIPLNQHPGFFLMQGCLLHCWVLEQSGLCELMSEFLALVSKTLFRKSGAPVGRAAGRRSRLLLWSKRSLEKVFHHRLEVIYFVSQDALEVIRVSVSLNQST